MDIVILLWKKNRAQQNILLEYSRYSVELSHYLVLILILQGENIALLCNNFHIITRKYHITLW